MPKCPNPKTPPPYLRTHGKDGVMFDMETIIKLNPKAFCKSQIKWLRKHPDFFSGKLDMPTCLRQLEAVKKACDAPKKRPAPKRVPAPSKKAKKELFPEIKTRKDGTRYAEISATLPLQSSGKYQTEQDYQPQHPDLNKSK